jgi:hypothetical protein
MAIIEKSTANSAAQAQRSVHGQAGVPWSWFSNARHAQAYEMQPSTEEVERLCGVVMSLLP